MTMSCSSSSSSSSKAITQRQVTLFKKAYELSILCGIEVCVIYYGPGGELKTWPQNTDRVKDMARRYLALSETDRRKKSLTLHDFMEKFHKDDSKNARLRSGGFKQLDPMVFNNYSKEQIMESLEHNFRRIQHRFDFVVESQKQRQNNSSVAFQEEQRMSHHLQQHPNHDFSLFLFDHGSGSLSQLPISAYDFNQAQSSLPPLPDSHMLYQNPSYLELLGVQDTGFNGFQTTNMPTTPTSTTVAPMIF